MYQLPSVSGHPYMANAVYLHTPLPQPPLELF